MARTKLSEQNLRAFDKTKDALQKNARSATFVGTMADLDAAEAEAAGGPASPFRIQPITIMDLLPDLDPFVTIDRPPPVSDPLQMDDARALVLFNRAAQRENGRKLGGRLPPQGAPVPELVTVASPCSKLSGMCSTVTYEVTAFLAECLRGKGFVVQSVQVVPEDGSPSESKASHYFTVVGRVRKGGAGAVVIDATWAQFGDASRAIRDVKPLCLAGGPASVMSQGDFNRHLGATGASRMLERYRTGLSALGQ